MMGRKGFLGKWFYNVSLEDRVPQDHLLRFVAAAVDFSFVRDLVRDTYSHTGAPSVDPVVIFKMALLGYLYGVTSERRLADEARLNLAEDDRCALREATGGGRSVCAGRSPLTTNGVRQQPLRPGRVNSNPALTVQVR